MRVAVLTGALVLCLAACGGTRDDVAAPASPPPGSTPSAPAAAPPSEPAAQECPLQARTVEPPAGATTDLAVKPVIAPSSAPPPEEVTVADIVVGSGDEATTRSQVEAKYVGPFYESAEEFDSSWSQGPDQTIPFTVCANGTVPGFAIGPTGMKAGGRRLITIPAQYGYGAEGQPPTIPPNSTLVFVIDLVSVSPPQG